MDLSRKRSLQFGVIISDCVMAFAAPYLALLTRIGSDAAASVHTNFAPFAVSSAVLSIALLWWFGVMRAAWRYFAFSDAMRAAKAIALAIAIAAVIAFAVNRLAGVSRAQPFIQFALQLSVFVSVRALLQRYWFQKSGSKAINPAGVLVIGCNPLAESYIRAIESLSQGKLEVAGVLSEDPALVGLTIRGKQVLGAVSQLRNTVTSLQVHGINLQKIAVALPEAALTDYQRATISKFTHDTQIQLIWLDSLFGDATGADVEPEAAHPELFMALGTYGPFKTVIDIVGSGLLLLILSPIFALVALLTLIDLGIPIYFWQKRLGKSAKFITLLKFRTMHGPTGPHGEILTDAQRTSAIGRFLRRTRLDELPQLVNIFRGEMSFVGPRPLLPIDQPTEVVARLSVKPGLTGWAQVNGGKHVTPEDKRALDLWYVSHASLWLDIKIAWLTCRMFARGDLLNQGAIQAATDWLQVRNDVILLGKSSVTQFEAEPATRMANYHAMQPENARSM